MTPAQPVFRFAPSPNGYLHLGHARSALLNHALAERFGGRFLLRIEDIDPVRSRPALVRAIEEDLAWLGIRWERPVLRQSGAFARYRAGLDRLVEGGHLYPCHCSRGEIAAEIRRREAESGRPWPRDPDGAPLYPGSCRNRPPGQGEAAAPPALRLRRESLPADSAWREYDLPALAHQRIVPAKEFDWGDVVVARRDVPTSYHLAVVMDDAEQGITHVVRGMDLYAATAIHVGLQRLLGLPAPAYAHHPLILDEAGRKLSKSDGAASLRQMRADGASPADIRRLAGIGALLAG